jgi:hypothetical protein
VSIALAATLLALLIALYAAPRLGDIGVGGTNGTGVATASGSRPAVHSVVAARPAWATHPFAAPFRIRLPWPAPKV